MTPVPKVSASAQASLRQRSESLHREQRQLFRTRVDRSFAVLMAVQYLACIGGAIATYPAPGHQASLDLVTAVVLGALFTVAPVALAIWMPARDVTRHAVAAGQMLMSGLLIQLSGGRIETHFHIFGSLAFLSFYRDWRVLLTASLVVAADQLFRTVWWPMTVFGASQIEIWRWWEQLGWIVFEDAFLILSIRQGQEMMLNLAERRAELEQARDNAVQASSAKDDFLAVLSHELRTPLTPSLMMLSALAESDRVDENTRSEIAIVYRNVQLEARLIDDLLDLTRIVAGKLQLSPGHVDLHSLLNHLLETCRPEFQEKQFTIVRKLEADRCWLYGDGARLQQVFWNLLRNAAKFTPVGGRIEVRTSDAGDKVRVDIVDSGVGISPELLPKIFQRFEQGGAAVTRQYGGLGLGLSISRSIVELHRGVIRADSRGAGWGATFTIVLPARAEAPQLTPITHTQKLRLSGKLPRRVLLVDDHADTRETLSRLLTRAGYEVTTAGTMAEALERAAAAKFDLLVSDLGLPDGHGYDLMRELHQQYGLPGIAFSGFGMEDDVRKSLEAGFSAHLTKPVDFKQLKEAMGLALNNPRRAVATTGA